MGRQFKPGQLQTGSLYNISSSFALTASYLQGYISPFPFTGSARITGSLGVTGSISTTTQFYHSKSLDSSNRTLTDGSSNTSIDWHNRLLRDGNGSTVNVLWDDTGTFGITTIPIIEKFDRDRIADELQYAYDNERIIVSGKILERPFIESGLTDGTLVYYNRVNNQWENFPQSSISHPSNFVTGSIGVVCNEGENVLLEGTITTVVNSAEPTASFGPTIIGDPEIGSPLFAAGSLSNPATDTVFSSQTPETTNDTVRILGHIIGKRSVDTGVDSYLIYFNPSNDFYTLSDRDRINTINGNRIFAAAAGTATSATSASFATQALSSSFAVTASFVNPLNQSVIVSGSLRGQVSTLSITSNTASVDISTNNFFTLTLANGANTHINPTNIRPGQTVNIRVNQGSLGTGTVSFPSFVDQASGSLYTGSAVANAIDIVTMITFDASSVFMSSIRNMI